MHALNNDDLRTVVTACAQLRKLNAAQELKILGGAATEPITDEAVRLDIEATNRTGSEAATLQAEAATHYRLAQSLVSGYSGNNPEVLNAIGYFLADKGDKPADWKQAEELTKRALLQVETVANVKDPHHTNHDFNDLLAIIRDSVAWSLFREQRFTEAEVQQEKVLAELMVADAQTQKASASDLHLHMAEIERALGHTAVALNEYHASLLANPHNAASSKALAALATKTKL